MIEIDSLGIHPHILEKLKLHAYEVKKCGTIESPYGPSVGCFTALLSREIEQWSFGDGCKCGAKDAVAITLSELITSAGCTFTTTTNGEKPYFSVDFFEHELSIDIDIVEAINTYTSWCEYEITDVQSPHQQLAQMDSLITAIEKAKSAMTKRAKAQGYL